MHRLFSNFARGGPGAGLLILRLTAGAALLNRSLASYRISADFDSMLLQTVLLAAAMLLIAGLWTPVVGSLVAIMEAGMLSIAFPIRSGELWPNLMLAALGIALALIGPGAWSVDARLFGWKRIQIRTPQSTQRQS